MIQCANKECENIFEPATHNQKYCCAECCRVATNRRIMEKYYDKRDQRQGKARYCINCDSKLSRYNDNRVCSSCELKQSVTANRSVANMLLSVNWQTV